MAREYDVWPVVFLCWRSRAEEVLQALHKGVLDVSCSPKLHIRKGAKVLVVVEDGGVLGAVTVRSVVGFNCDFSVDAIAESLTKLPTLKGELLSTLRGVPRPFIKGPVTAFPLPPGDKAAHGLTLPWFDAVLDAVLPKPATAAPPVVQRREASTPDPAGAEPEANKQRADHGCAPNLSDWIPPALAGLLEGHVRADLWEDVVADAFTALGCEVERLGKRREGEAVPDSIVRHKKYQGSITTLVEFVVDCKAGFWAAPVDDIRAMREYLTRHHGTALFVANALAKDVPMKLAENPLGATTARALTGRHLAQWLHRRLTDPQFDVHQELQKLAR